MQLTTYQHKLHHGHPTAHLSIPFNGTWSQPFSHSFRLWVLKYYPYNILSTWLSLQIHSLSIHHQYFSEMLTALKMKDYQLICDVDTHWSSTLIMIDHALLLQCVISYFRWFWSHLNGSPGYWKTHSKIRHGRVTKMAYGKCWMGCTLIVPVNSSGDTQLKFSTLILTCL